mmetsp:Transcript_91175/g.292695  ORF Transcript_91175/g.292695 Transcript_91175/m.292695 type:complete len:342 (-) Transcript_91175:130-1155(-)
MDGDHPIRLAEGKSPTEVLTILPASVWKRRYLLDGCERIEWDLKVLDSHDIVFTSKVSCPGLQQGVDRSEEITERERSEEFAGFVDLGKDHDGMLKSLGVASTVIPSPSSSSSSVCKAVLELELDNYYSYFTPKRVELCISKSSGVPSRAKSFDELVAACEPNSRWEHALRLFGKMRDANVVSDVQMYNKALAVLRDAARWEECLLILAEMRSTGVEPDPTSYDIATTACENAGRADMALKLLDSLDVALLGGLARVDRFGAGEDADDDDVVFLRSALREAVIRCPPKANDVMGHLLAAQESLEHFARRGERATCMGLRIRLDRRHSMLLARGGYLSVSGS